MTSTQVCGVSGSFGCLCMVGDVVSGGCFHVGTKLWKVRVLGLPLCARWGEMAGPVLAENLGQQLIVPGRKLARALFRAGLAQPGADEDALAVDVDPFARARRAGRYGQ